MPVTPAPKAATPSPAPTPATAQTTPAPAKAEPTPAPAKAQTAPAPAKEEPVPATNAYFCGDSSFFSLQWALQTIAREKLTGALRRAPRPRRQVIVLTTREPGLYCEESPVTLLNVEANRVEAARAQQSRDDCPLFITLASAGLILREPGLQLVQHYGQKLFGQLWTAERVRLFSSNRSCLPTPAICR